MKKTTIAVILIVISILFTSCDIATISVDNMLTPPKLSGELEQIYNVFVKSISKEVKLKYPKSGDHRSAITLVDIDSESSDEAIVFYETPSTTTESYTLRVNILDQVDGDWVTVYNLGVEAVGVDRFSVVDTDTGKLLIVGFTTIGTSKSNVKIYSFENNQLIEKISQSCNTHEIMDINNDYFDELILFINRKLQNDVSENSAVMVTLSDNTFTTSPKVILDPEVTDYLSISKGAVSTKKGRLASKALYIDGIKGNGVVSTQILTYKNNALASLIYNAKKPNLELIDATSRTTKIFCTDLDKDSIYEIPKLLPFVNYASEEKHNQIYYTQWSNFVENSLDVKYYSFSDFSLNFMIMLEQEWMDKITVVKDTTQNLSSFLYYDATTGNTFPLFDIKAVKRLDYENHIDSDDFTLIETSGQVSYLYKLYKTNPNLKITSSDIVNRFKILI